MKITIFSLLLWCAWCGVAAAGEQRIVCPEVIARDTIQITRAPAGWTGFYPYEFQPGLPLNSAGLMWGPPSTMTIAKPRWIGTIRGRDAERWTELTPGEKWMACFYGDHGANDAILSRPVDASATECTVTYPKKRSGALDIVCRW
jgi:hypothetical protein